MWGHTMLEQTFQNGRLYRSREENGTLKTNPVNWTDLSVGPLSLIQLVVISDREVWVESVKTHIWRHYLGGAEETLYLQETLQRTLETSPGEFYYYGITKEGEPCFLKQEIPDKAEISVPETATFSLPFTLRTLCFPQIFSYPEELKTWLSGLPATYMDRYKRPIIRKQGHTLPISIEKAKTTWSKLPDTYYPIAVSLKGTAWAVLDLEPEHTKEERAEYDRIPGFYEEETIHGGRHKLIQTDKRWFKGRFGPGLELIDESQITFYGIHGRINKQPEAIDPLEHWVEVGKGVQRSADLSDVTKEAPEVAWMVSRIKKQAYKNGSKVEQKIAKLLAADSDISHAEYASFRICYESDVGPYGGQISADIYPWVLAAYGAEFIPYRDKHDTRRNGLPYLVYLSAIIIKEKDGMLVWRDEPLSY